jgi:hypothetical protein
LSLYDEDNTSTGIVPGQGPPCTDLQIEIKVNCPLDLALIEYVENIEVPDFEFRYSCMNNSPDSLFTRRDHEPEFILKMHIHCPTPSAKRLPSSFEYVIRSSDFNGGLTRS